MDRAESILENTVGTKVRAALFEPLWPTYGNIFMRRQRQGEVLQTGLPPCEGVKWERWRKNRAAGGEQDGKINEEFEN